MPKLLFRIVPDSGAMFTAIFNIDARSLDNLQIAILKTPGLMTGETNHIVAEALLAAEIFQHEGHEDEEQMEFKEIGRLSPEEVKELVSVSTLHEFGPGQGPAILAGVGAEKITIEMPNEEAKT